MKKTFKTLLVLIIALLLVSGILIFVYRLPILDYLNEAMGISDTSVPNVDSFSQAEMINFESLKSSRLDSLKNQVTSFNFDNVCKRPASLQASSSACAVGNPQPF